MNEIKRIFRPERGFGFVEMLDGYIFTPEANAHKFIITQMVKANGEETEQAFAVGSTVSCRFLKSDKVTELLEGTLEDGAACVTLKPECYSVPGRFLITILVTSGSSVTCVYAASGTVIGADSENVNISEGASRAIDDAIAEINAAAATAQAAVSQVQTAVAGVPAVIASIPQDYTALSNSVGDLKSAVIDIGDIGYVPADLGTIVRGVVYVQNPMTVAESTTRLVMNAPLDLGTSMYVQCNGQKFVCYVYNSSDEYSSALSITSWVDADTIVTVPSGYKVRFIFSKLDNSTIYVGDRTVTVSKASPIAQAVNTVAYFSAGTNPAFVETLNGASSTLDCTFPSADFRIYHCGNLLCNTNAYGNTKFELSNMKKLVWNMSTGVVSVVDVTNTGTQYVELLAMTGESVTGLLSGYYRAYIHKRLCLAMSGRVYISGPSFPLFAVLKDYNVKVTFKDAYQLRIYWNGTHYSYTCTAGENYTVSLTSALVYNCLTNAVSVKSSTAANANEILLFSWQPFGAYGLLAPYFYESTTLRAVDHYKGLLAPALYCQRLNESLGYIERTNCDARIAFVSDIHKTEKAFQQMLNFTNQLGSTWFDVIVNGGDTVANLGSEGLTWYNSMVDTSALPILNCVGNHDVWYGNSTPYSQYTAVETYQLITKKVAQTASITQPDNAETNGYNYYYKDINNVRIIVIDVMNWNSTQKDWLAGILSNAKTNSKHVICVTHGMFTTESAMTYPTNPRNSIHPRDGYGTNIEAAETVYQFIQDGGKFVCWLSGHTHADEVAYLPDYGNQYIVAVTTPRDGMTDTPKAQDINDLRFTAFDCIGVDTVNGTVKFQRVGADTNWNMVKHDKLCIDYINHQILS